MLGRLSALLALSALLVPEPSRAGAPPAGLGADPAEVRARAAAAGRASATPVLVRALGADPEPLVRAAAASALGRARDPSSAAPLAAALLEDPDPGVREEAAGALAALARRIDARLLARAGQELLPEDAHLGLDGTLQPEAAAALARAASDPSAAVRRAAVRALGETRADHPSVLPALADRVAHDGETAVRALAAQALARLGRRDAVAPLARALGDPSAAVRMRAAAGLGRLAGPGEADAPLPADARARLHRAAGDDAHAAVRAAAIEALVAWSPAGDAALTTRLSAALDDRAEQVRLAAALGLLAVGHDGGRLDLDRRITLEQGAAARAALHALRAGLDPTAADRDLDALVDLLGDAPARRAAERGLVLLERAGLPVAAVLRARLAAGTPGAHPDGPVARALARVEAGGPLVVPDARP